MFGFTIAVMTLRLGKLPQKHSTGKLFKADENEDYEKSFLRAVKPGKEN